MADFALIALPGAYRTSVGALTDTFQLARDRVAHLYASSGRTQMETRLRIYSLDGAPVMLSDGSALPVDGALSEDEHTFVWLPAFRAEAREPLETCLARTQELQSWLVGQHARGAIIGASGAASTLVMAAGLTRDMPVPIARAMQPLTRTLFPRQRFEDRRGIVDTGSIAIANGFANDLSLIVRIVDRAISPDIARWLTSTIGLDSKEEDLLSPDPLVARAQLWIEQRFTEPMSMTELAASLSTSLATLNRRFQRTLGLSPKAYLQQRRLQAAVRMLEKSNRSIDRIAALIGYSDSRLFRTMFRQQTGMTATEWRAQARGARRA